MTGCLLNSVYNIEDVRKIKANELDSALTDRLGLTMYDSIVSYLHYKPEKCYEVFKSLIVKALVEFAQYYPLQMRATLTESPYIFKPNFDEFLEGRINSSQLILVPEGIYHVRNGRWVSYQWVDFDRNNRKLLISNGNIGGYVEYFANYPYVLDIAPDGKFTEDSYIYFLDYDEEIYFLDYVSYFVCRHVKNLVESVEVDGQTVHFLKSINNAYDELKEQLEKYKSYRWYVMRQWRK